MKKSIVPVYGSYLPLLSAKEAISPAFHCYQWRRKPLLLPTTDISKGSHNPCQPLLSVKDISVKEAIALAYNWYQLRKTWFLSTIVMLSVKEAISPAFHCYQWRSKPGLLSTTGISEGSHNPCQPLLPVKELSVKETIALAYNWYQLRKT